MKGSQKVEELKLWPKNDPYNIWWTLTCCWIKRSNTLSLCEKRQNNYNEAACFISQPPPLFFNKDNETLKIRLLNDVTRKLKKKWLPQALSACKEIKLKGLHHCVLLHDVWFVMNTCIYSLTITYCPIRCHKTEVRTVGSDRIRSPSE